MPAVDRLPPGTRQTILTLPVTIHDSTPFTLPAKPLKEARFALVTTAGLHLRGDKPFFSGDATYRRIPASTHPSEIVQSHSSIGFDRTAAIADLNVVFPLDRLREMTSTGRIGELAATFYSFMGAQRDTRVIEEQTGPEVARLLLVDRVDVVLFTPT